MNFQRLTLRVLWPSASLLCALMLGCGEAGRNEQIAPTRENETIEAKRAKIAMDLTAAEAKRTELIESFVRDLLSTGPLPKTAVVTAAEEISIKSEEVTEAVERLGVVSVEANGGLRWKLPE